MGSDDHTLWDAITASIRAAEGGGFTPADRHGVGGGCINQAWTLTGDGQRYFVKLNDAARLDMFEAEAEGLSELRAANAIRVPRPVATGTAAGRGYLVMEHITFDGRESSARFGAELAALHRRTAERFGWHRDNTIGATPQVNTWNADWVAFWREQRLGFQLDLAARRGAGTRLVDRGHVLMEHLPAFFADYRPLPSLLHGDLWGGNMETDRDGRPVIFDPAVYYGDREADLAMTELFGGPGGAFYRAYDDAWPIDPGYGVRKTLYNLYHILNHYNLFGGGYADQAERMTDRLLAELG
ncbi:MAG TPA: fructosamine kinase family protein [Thioalkalivibrio sp.]|nr:fructosamine kinase family protein [Thioalkalivibrio sp.]